MADNNSLINLEGVAEPAKMLIEKVSDAIGVLYEPHRIEKRAIAEAKAEKIKAVTEIEIGELQKRAIDRLIFEETSKQVNVENITGKALPLLDKTSHPENIGRDWLVDFFDKAKLISDVDMQMLWAQILAGEANKTNSFSKRSIHIVAELDKDDAILFDKLCSFVWDVSGLKPLIFDHKDKLYKDNNIHFDSLTHLDSIGLIKFEPIGGYTTTGFPKIITVTYRKDFLTIEFSKEGDNSLPIGHVLFTQVGNELASICNPKIVNGMVEYAAQYWVRSGYKVKNSLGSDVLLKNETTSS